MKREEKSATREAPSGLMGAAPVGTENSAHPAEAILGELQRILASSEFAASERNRRFLRHVVEETLAGRAERIKAYCIATEVFERAEDFDPQSDPIVRIEAGRLRRALEHYYLTAGLADPIRIAIPKGGYVPTFEYVRTDPATDRAAPAAAGSGAAAAAPDVPARRAFRLYPTAATAAACVLLVLIWLGVSWFGEYPPFAPNADEVAAAHPRGPAIFIAPFQDDDGGATSLSLTRGFTREVVMGLTRFKDLFVFGAETSFWYGGELDMRRIVSELGADYIVTGGLSISTDRFRAIASLIDARSGRYVWSEQFNGNLAASEFPEARAQIAARIVQALAQPYGVIFNDKVREIEGKPPRSLGSYECVLRFQQYWRKLAPEQFGAVRECLERTVEAEPDYAEALSSLALMYVDAYRFKLDKGTIEFEPLPRALELAQQAVDLAPDSVHGYKALQLVYWLMHDVERSLETAARGFALNPNDSEIMAEFGGRMYLTGQWAKGLPLVKEAFARNPAQPGLYRVVLFLDHYFNGRFEDALGEAKKMDLPGVIHMHVAQAMAYAQLGRMQEAAAALERVLAIDPAYGEHVVQDLEGRNVHPDIITAAVEGLRKAGLPVTDYPGREGS
jgi:TolB-like protein